jgi:outer membrane biosynthesis protein TonB
MKLFQYIQGNRKGKEINRLEKEAMKDPFLADALEGFDKATTDNHELRIEEMRAEILNKTKSGKNHIVRYLSLAASVLLIVGLGGYFLLNKDKFNTEENLAKTQFDLIVPEEQIIENEPLQDSSLPETKQQAEKSLVAETKAKKEISSAIAKNRRKAIDDKKPIETTKVQEVQEDVQAEIQAVENESNKTISRKGKVKGIITDSEGEPLPGASITYSGTNTGTVSDTDGYFELPESDNKNIQVNYLGYESQNLVADKDTTMLVAMTENTNELAEVTVVAFGTQKKESMVASVSSSPERKENNIKPQPVIGKKAYEKYLKENIVKPQSEVCKEKKGKVKLKFSINQKGRPVNIRVEKSLCPEADDEAIRLINKGSDWTVGDKDVEIEVKF